ncbi:MAG: TMEM165/GDT1 family protein [Clostridia bacterium]|nr:TMEM165/GDT1 family protein [Clostridia bacterium]
MREIKNFPKIPCIGILAVAFVYGLILPFCWGNDPTAEHGTLSLLCEDRKVFFWIWGILTSGSIIINTQYMYRKFSYKNKFFDTLCALAFIFMGIIALTLGHSIEDWNPKRLAHWIATGLFIALTVAPILLFFIVNRKRYKSFDILSLCTLLILSTFIIIFAVVGKSALMEMVPIALVEVFLFIINFTPAVKTEYIENLPEEIPDVVNKE